MRLGDRARRGTTGRRRGVGCRFFFSILNVYDFYLIPLGRLGS
jgi:hypothetical protein